MNSASKGYLRLPLNRNVPNLTTMPNQPELSKRMIRLLFLLLIPAMISAIAIYYIWSTQPDLEYWKILISDGHAYLEAHPMLLVLALTILPGIGFPLSPLLMLFGIVISPRFGLPLTCVVGITAISLCSIWTYLLASGPLRIFLKTYLLKKWVLPKLSDRSALHHPTPCRMSHSA